MKNNTLFARAKFSIAGLRHAWARERSFRTQICLSVAAMAVLGWLQPEPIWWAVILLAMAVASAMELLNGALEALVDHLHPSVHPQIGIAKDMASAAAFIANGATVTVFLILGVGRFS